MGTEPQAGSSGGFLGLSLFLSFRRNQVASMETIDPSPSPPPPSSSSHDLHDGELAVALDGFRSHFAGCLLSLRRPADSSSAPPLLLSLPFLSDLLDALVSCDREFHHLLLLLPTPPPPPSSSSSSSSSSSLLLLSKPVAEFLDRSVKLLDSCNAASAALLTLRHWRRQADIAAAALLLPAAAPRAGRPLSLSRARRALARLFADFRTGGGSSWRAPSKNWTGAAAAAAAAAPAGGMAEAACAMSSLLGFAAWALAAAVPFLERGGGSAAAAPAAPPRQLHWARAMAELQERIAEECAQRKRGYGPLAEVRAVETRARCLMELIRDRSESGGPAVLDDSEEAEFAAKAAELAEACRALEEGAELLERQVRAVFHRVAATRAEVMRCLDRSARRSAA